MKRGLIIVLSLVLIIFLFFINSFNSNIIEINQDKITNIITGNVIYNAGARIIKNNEKEDLVIEDKFKHLRGFKQIKFKTNYDNSPIKSFNKENTLSSSDKVKNKFTSDSLEIETIYEEVDTGFFNVDERPVKQTYVLKNLKDNKKDIKLNILYGIDSDTILWNATEYDIDKNPVYFKAFNTTIELMPGLNETFLTGHTLYFGNNYYDFKDVVNLDYSVSVYSLSEENYIDLEIRGEVEALSEFVVDPVIGWESHIILENAEAWSIFAIDVDGDNDVDVISSRKGPDLITWHENNGSSPPGWKSYNISILDKDPRDIFAIDIDGDNDIDVIAGTLNGGLIGFENNGSSPPGWRSFNISNDSKTYNSIYAIDIDGDQDIDVTGSHYWFENNGSSPPGWKTHELPGYGKYGFSEASTFSIDIDRDGDNDMIETIFDTGDNFNHIRWYENNGSSPPGWEVHTITSSFNGSEGVFADDMDNDSDIDIIAVSFYGRTIMCENNGSSPPGWTIHNISDKGSDSIYIRDLNNDDNLDFLVGSIYGWYIWWYENDGSSPAEFTENYVFDTLGGAKAVFSIDIDNDGDNDIIGGGLHNYIKWYESNLNDLSIQEITPIQVVENVDMVKGKTTLVRTEIKNNKDEEKNINVSLYFEDVFKTSKTETINANEEKDVDLWFIPDEAGDDKKIKIDVEEI